MLKLCLANAIFVINYPRKKNCSVLHSTTYLPCHLLPVGVSHLLGLIPGKKIINNLHVLRLLIISQAGP